MEKTEQAQLKAKKKSFVGIIGFALGLAGISSCGLTAIPGLILCVIGIIRKGHRILSSIGLIICLFWLPFLSVWTPPGSIPYPFSVAKYSVTAPAFWVGYDIRHLREAQSQYWLFGGAGGSLFFKAKLPNTFKENEVIEFASKYNWEFTNKTQMTDEDFAILLNEKGRLRKQIPKLDFDEPIDQEHVIEMYDALEKKYWFLNGLTVGKSFPIWIRKNCIILSFKTGKSYSPSNVVINSNGTEMAIYYDGSR
ncbi:MAG: hypothetical protein ACYS67_13060 [Planctomycetota bacterium]|jgi:hypothetical protein